MKIKYLISAVLIGILSSCTPAPQPQPQESEKPEEQQKPDPKPDESIKITVITGDAIGITQTEATLSGSYENVTTQLREHGFYWGTSETALTGTINLEENSAEAAVFKAILSNLEPETKYYFQAYVTVKDLSTDNYVDIKGDVKSFTTSSTTTPPDDQDINNVVVTTMTATGISNTAATLNGSYSGVTMELRDHGFYWGTSTSDLSETIGLNSGTSETDIFEATISSLESGTTYYFKAYVTVWDKVQEKYVDVEGDIKSFTTSGGTSTTDPPGPEKSLPYLDCYEMPAITMLTNYSKPSGNGQDSSGPWWNYETTNSMQMIITHAFSYGGRQRRNWTALFDGDKQAPIWTAFVMHKDEYPDNNVGRGSWHSDPAVSSSWQHTTIFEKGGEKYHRGHLVASNYRQASKSADNFQTFYYTNQALQEQDHFNASIWQNLEKAVASGAPSSNTDTLYVVVGLLFEGDPRQNATASDIEEYEAPSHFYTLLMKCGFNADGSIKTAKGVAYLMENRAYANGSNYNDYTTTIDAIEERTGFDFYANVPADLQEAAEKTSASVW